MQIFVNRNNQKYGPYSLEDVQEYLASGHITGADMAWHEGAPDWVPLSQIPGVQVPSSKLPPPPPLQVPPSLQATPGQATSVPAPRAGESEQEREIFNITPTAQAFLWPVTIVSVLTLFFGFVPMLIWAFLQMQSTRYRLTTQRLIIQKGIVTKRTEEIELYRVKDVSVHQGFVQRTLGYGSLTILSNDGTTPSTVMDNIAKPLEIKELLRQNYRNARRTEGVHATEFIRS